MNSHDMIRASLERLAERSVACWGDIDGVLDELAAASPDPALPDFSSGVAFVTFDYGIDGVSIEIAKYASCLERLLSSAGETVPVHLVAGEFTDRADQVLDAAWVRHEWPNANGWAKWDGGEWFARMFYEDMPSGSEASREIAAVIWEQGLALAHRLCEVIMNSGVELLVPVNVNSNPGNMATALAMVIGSELSGVCVLNSNHDFYWEGGSVAGEGGVRDHFFRNHANSDFFDVLTRVFPWNGGRWLQMNINARQSDTLEAEYGFDRCRLGEVGTAISDAFFRSVSVDERREKRRAMGCILAQGERQSKTVSIDEFIGSMGEWMGHQVPRLLGRVAGTELDFGHDGLVYLLQPTRVVDRKRIDRDCVLIQALFTHADFVRRFEESPERRLLLHVSGPVPIEHQSVLLDVVEAFRELIESLPESFADRVFLAFSVGTEEHAAMADLGLKRVYIHDIYKLADLVVFPSETEGRGLPIVESCASDVPIVCSRYEPEIVFAGVIGEHLPEEQQIKYSFFPPGSFPEDLLEELTLLLFEPEACQARFTHNRGAVKSRYGTTALEVTFRRLLDQLLVDWPGGVEKKARE